MKLKAVIWSSVVIIAISSVAAFGLSIAMNWYYLDKAGAQTEVATSQKPPINAKLKIEAAREYENAVNLYRDHHCQDAALAFEKANNYIPSQEAMLQVARSYLCAADQYMQQLGVLIVKEKCDPNCVSREELKDIVKSLKSITNKTPKVRLRDFALDEPSPF